MNYHQTPEEIIKAATPEQKIFWNDIFLRYGERLVISQYRYCGAVGGSGLEIYTARRLFFGLHIDHSAGGIGFLAGGGVIYYDDGNAAYFNASNDVFAWNTTGAAFTYGMNSFNIKNMLFSRIAVTRYLQINFLGYRITY